ncbi:MAG: hypothetical protein NC187_07940 [Candidatus Amulumruptor caecigallinarius]|nr:hypothetical protein [Candidatus Amulumruptor caecigallinarius]MCM1397400.1 hypothetical protein [Candidatus Amulumruptor caecigallinarius]MCM1454485.1 hypothetical protein [bacterium]
MGNPPADITPKVSLEWLMPFSPEASELTLVCPAADYSASRIAHAVEDCDAHLLNLNVTAGSAPGGLTLVHLRVTHREPAAVARSLERYGYEVVDSTAASGHDDSDEARRRALEAAHYLSLGSEL